MPPVDSTLASRRIRTRINGNDPATLATKAETAYTVCSVEPIVERGDHRWAPATPLKAYDKTTQSWFSAGLWSPVTGTYDRPATPPKIHSRTESWRSGPLNRADWRRSSVV